MGGRDHAVECERCGALYGGFNGPEECPCRDSLPQELVDAYQDLERAARKVAAFLDGEGPDRFRFNRKHIDLEAQVALLSMHDYLNDVERTTKAIDLPSILRERDEADALAIRDVVCFLRYADWQEDLAADAVEQGFAERLSGRSGPASPPPVSDGDAAASAGTMEGSK